MCVLVTQPLPFKVLYTLEISWLNVGIWREIVTCGGVVAIKSKCVARLEDTPSPVAWVPSTRSPMVEGERLVQKVFTTFTLLSLKFWNHMWEEQLACKVCSFYLDVCVPHIMVSSVTIQFCGSHPKPDRLLSSFMMSYSHLTMHWSVVYIVNTGWLTQFHQLLMALAIFGIPPAISHFPWVLPHTLSKQPPWEHCHPSSFHPSSHQPGCPVILLCQFKIIWLPRICQAFLPLFLENEREPDRETQWCWARWGGWDGAVNLNSANIAIALHVELCLAAHTACPLLWLGGQWVPVFLTKIYLDAGKIRVSTWRHWSSSIHCIFFSFDCNQCTQ